MYVVTVLFNVKKESTASFRKAVLQQARHSLSRETDCLRFDVCFDPQDDTRVFLYEIYADEKAFQEHLHSDHFSSFNAKVTDWLERKSVQNWVKPGSDPVASQSSSLSGIEKI